MKVTVSKLHLIAYSFIVFFVLLVDRITKLYAIANLKVPHEVTSFLSGELVFNQGISWGMFNNGDGSNFLVVSMVVIFVTSILVYYAYTRIKLGYTIYGELLVIVGSISNILDRTLYNGVVDFISFHYSNYRFPYFNIADSCIVLGVCIMFIQMLHEA